MKLKRLYDMSDEKAPKVNGVEILHAGKRQRFSPDLVLKAVAQGWMVLGDGTISIKAKGGDAVYKVMRGPGYFCCHCGRAVDDGMSARAHIEAEHAGEKSPDQNNPSGYERTHHYDCVKE